MSKRKRLTKEDRQAVYDKMGGHCAYCGCDLTLKDMQVDHMIPMEMYDAYMTIGKDIDSMENYMPACRSCNHYKSTMTVERFRVMLERGPEILARDSVTYRNAVRFGLVEPKPHHVQFYFERIGKEEALK